MTECYQCNPNSIQLYECFDEENEISIVTESCDDNLLHVLMNRKEGFR